MTVPEQLPDLVLRHVQYLRDLGHGYDRDVGIEYIVSQGDCTHVFHPATRHAVRAPHQANGVAGTPGTARIARP
ncbi:hypothetical protein GCM10009676_31740 [Prauserella halophila]|uniref:Uncharacterized protein n=1 Tax=Prauserella halophila TaxID=185641 RepID=A0ABN1WHL8_9PSEU